MRKVVHAENSRITLYAQLVLAAIDMDDVRIFDKPVSFLRTEYSPWKEKNPTLSAKFRREPPKPRDNPATDAVTQAEKESFSETITTLTVGAYPR